MPAPWCLASPWWTPIPKPTPPRWRGWPHGACAIRRSPPAIRPTACGSTSPAVPICTAAKRRCWPTCWTDGRILEVRLGLRMAKGLSNEDGARIIAHRAGTPYSGVEELWRRAGVPAAALEKLAEADA